MKKLYKSNDKVICGVCGGLADYCGMDASIMRLLVIISCFITGGLVIIAYIVMACIVPFKNEVEDKNRKKERTDFDI